MSLGRGAARPAVAARRSLLVVHPHAYARGLAELWDTAVQALRSDGAICTELKTCGDETNVGRITSTLRDTCPEIAIAAGGDGTVRDVVQAIMDAGCTPPPALAILPFGTANNVARSLGLQSCRHGGQAALDLAITTALSGTVRRIDLGRVGGRYFVGSFAAGMDADILCSRNRYRRVIRTRALSGYPLYLWSCAVNLMRHHGAAARLHVDGAARSARAYNVLVTNTPIYAGEFRFDAEAQVDDGCLDLHLFSGPLDYVRGFVTAWRRHVACTRGRPVQPPDMHRVHQVILEFDAPVASQIDGEEFVATSRYEVQVHPRVLKVLVPGAVE